MIELLIPFSFNFLHNILIQALNSSKVSVDQPATSTNTNERAEAED